MRSIKLLWGRVSNVPGLARDLVAIIALAGLGLAATGYIWSNYGWTPPWEDRYTFAAEFDYAGGVRPESRQEVRVAGVTVGKIASVEPASGGNARISMSIDPEVAVYDNARAVLRTKTPVNIMYIALDPGGPPGKRLPKGGIIPVSQTERRVAPFEILDKLDQRAQAAITALIDDSDVALAKAPQHLPGGLRSTDATLTKLQPVVERLESRRENIARLVTALSQISTAVGSNDERLARLTSALQETLGVLSAHQGDLGATLEQLPGLNGDLRRAMTGTSKLTKQLNPTLDAVNRASGELPEALARLTDTVDEAGKLIDAAAPVVEMAKPVVADLRPFSRDLNGALGDLAPVTGHLPSATQQMVPWMNDLAAFVYQTSSVFSLYDGTGGWGRGNVQVVLPTDAMFGPNLNGGVQ